MLRRTLFCLVLASGCGIAATAQAQQFIYKWTDEQGQSKYSELPPPAGVTYEMVRKPSGPSSGVIQTTPDPAKEQEKKAAEEAAKQKEQEERAQKDAEDVRAKNCEIAKKNVQVLQGDSPVVKTDANGNKAPLDAPQREAELKKAQKDQDYFCNP
ncbi:MAG: DUF4124 domain-containing protein [Candidatus Competibacteraceae bacterium]|nr:MAG: DUF4124 domain-containing protein [Candidatus Competibacteraceae bacterium]